MESHCDSHEDASSVAGNTGHQHLASIIDQRFEALIDGMEKSESFFLDVDARYDCLNDDLSTVDREISDIDHYIEFNNLNACDGFKAYRELQKRLRRRRVIKDEMLILSRIRCCKITKKEVNDVKNAVYGLSTRKYAPRELKNIF